MVLGVDIDELLFAKGLFSLAWESFNGAVVGFGVVVTVEGVVAIVVVPRGVVVSTVGVAKIVVSLVAGVIDVVAVVTVVELTEVTMGDIVGDVVVNVVALVWDVVVAGVASTAEAIAVVAVSVVVVVVVVDIEAVVVDGVDGEPLSSSSVNTCFVLGSTIGIAFLGLGLSVFGVVVVMFGTTWGEGTGGLIPAFIGAPSGAFVGRGTGGTIAGPTGAEPAAVRLAATFCGSKG